MVFEFTHLPFAILVASSFKMPRLYKSADAAAGFYYAGSFKLQIDLGDGIGVNAQVDRKLPDRRQLLPDGELARRDRKPDRPLELVIERRRVRRVDVQYQRHCPIVLRQ